MNECFNILSEVLSFTFSHVEGKGLADNSGIDALSGVPFSINREHGRSTVVLSRVLQRRLLLKSFNLWVKLPTTRFVVAHP